MAHPAGVGILALGRGRRRGVGGGGLLGRAQPATLMAGVSQQQMAKVNHTVSMTVTRHASDSQSVLRAEVW